MLQETNLLHILFVFFHKKSPRARLHVLFGRTQYIDEPPSRKASSKWTIANVLAGRKGQNEWVVRMERGLPSMKFEQLLEACHAPRVNS